MRYQLIHTTAYEYQNTVSSCHNMAMLKPRSNAQQQLVDFRLEIDPLPYQLSEQIDFFGNTQHAFSIQTPHTALTVTARSIIERHSMADTLAERIAAARSITLEQLPGSLSWLDNDTIYAKQFLFNSPIIRTNNQALYYYVMQSFAPSRSVYEATLELMTRIFHDFQFVPGYTDISTPTDTIFEERKGVCQDFAQVAIAGLRSVGVPAKYISGYIETLPPPGVEKLIGADASHAWFAAYLPGHGWFEFDPTNNQVPLNQHILLATGRDYTDIVPLKGVIYSTGDNKMSVSVDLRTV